MPLSSTSFKSSLGIVTAAALALAGLLTGPGPFGPKLAAQTGLIRTPREPKIFDIRMRIAGWKDCWFPRKARPSSKAEKPEQNGVYTSNYIN